MNRGEGLARWLIQHAARTAPSSLSERLEEEWLADLEARRGLMEKLRLAAGCCWATRVIAHEHCAAGVAAAAGVTAMRLGSTETTTVARPITVRMARMVLLSVACIPPCGRRSAAGFGRRTSAVRSAGSGIAPDAHDRRLGW